MPMTIEQFVADLNLKWPKKHTFSDVFMFTEGKRLQAIYIRPLGGMRLQNM